MNRLKGNELANQFEKGLEYLEYSPGNFRLIQEYAHLLAFYLNEPKKAIEILEKGLAIPKLKPNKQGC